MITVAAGIFRTTDCAAGFMGAVAKQALARYGIVIGAHINNVGEILTGSLTHWEKMLNY